jgi:GT2 family glycosyltransferase
VLGIVVLNWNGGARTIACVESVRAQAYPEKFIVLVDNASAAPERDVLRDRYGDDSNVQLCFLDSNRGYTGGMNAGIAQALAGGADMVVLLTQDAALRPGALLAMVAVAAADARIGVVGPMIVDSRPPHRILSVGERVRVPLLCVPRTLLRYRHPRFPWYQVSGVMGCALLLTRRCFETVGGFDEELFMYYEETDLCLRARALGFMIACAPHAVVIHDGLRGFRAGFTAESAELKARNLLRLMRRWARTMDWLVLIPTCCLLFAGSMSLYTLRGRGDIVRALARGIVAGVRRRAERASAIVSAH